MIVDITSLKIYHFVQGGCLKFLRVINNLSHRTLMFKFIFLTLSLFVSFSAISQEYEVLKKGSSLLLKEPLRMVFVGTDILAPIPLPYKNKFLLLTANSNGYSTTLVGPDYDLAGWGKTDAIVFEGDFLDGYAGNEIFIQGKGITFSGGAKNAYITSENTYVGEVNHTYSNNVASASRQELTMVTQGGKAYLQINKSAIPTITYRQGESYNIIPQDFENTQIASDVTLITAPYSQVTPNGMFTSSYPISLPAGNGGIKPSLAVTYVGSNIKNGNLGYGFTLSGIETINVCTSNADSLNGHSVKTNLSTSENIQLLCFGGKTLLNRNNDYTWYYLKDSPLIRFSKNENEITQHLPNGDEKLFRLVNPLTYALVESKSINGSSITYSYTNTGQKATQPKLNTITWGDYSASLVYSNKRNDFDIKLSVDGSAFYSNQSLLTDVNVTKEGAMLSSHHLSYELLAGLSRYSIDSIQSCGYVPNKECSQAVNYGWSEVGSFVGEQISIGNDPSESLVKVKLSKGVGETLISYSGNTIKDYQGDVIGTIDDSLGNIVSIHPVRKGEKDNLLILVSKKRYVNGNDWVRIDNTERYLGVSGQTTGECRNKFGPGAVIDTRITGYIDQYPQFAYGCFGPLNEKEKILISISHYWHELEYDMSSNALSSSQLVAFAGCYGGGFELPQSFMKTSAYLNDQGMTNGIPTSYLRVFSKTSKVPVESECITASNLTNYNVGYLGYSGSDFSNQPTEVSFQGDIDLGITSIVKYLNSGKVNHQLNTFVEDVTTFQSDIDGNGVVDRISLIAANTKKAKVMIKFNAPYKGSSYDNKDSNLANLPYRIISRAIRNVDQVIPYDLDHDGIKELLYAKGGSVRYLKIIFDPINMDIVIDEFELPRFQEIPFELVEVIKIYLLDVDNDGKQELAVESVYNNNGLFNALSIHKLSIAPRISSINYGNTLGSNDNKYGGYTESINYDDTLASITYDADFETTEVNRSAQVPVSHSLVSGFKKQFNDTASSTVELSNISYDYYKPLRHTLHGYDFGFNKVTITDEITKNISETTYNQDKWRQGLVASSVSKIDLSGSKHIVGKTDYTYKFYGALNEGHAPNVITTTNYLRGVEAGSSTTQYTYDDYGRADLVTSKQFDTAGVELKSQIVDNTYKNTSFVFTEAYDNLLTQQDTTITIPAVSSLVTTGYQAGTNTSRTKYIESTSIPGTIAETQSGYVKNSTFTQLSSEKVSLAAVDNGNPSQVIKTGFAASTAAANDTLEFTSYDGANPTGITHKFGGNEFGTSSYSYDALGRLLSETTIEGNATSYTYDAFGRVKTLTTTRDSATYEYLSCADGNACSGLTPSVVEDNIVWMNSVTWTSGKIERSFIDAYGRTVASSWNNELDETLFSWQEYDTKGRLVKEYLPCKLSACAATSPHTLYEYETNSDDLWQTKKILADGTVIKSTIKTSTCLAAMSMKIDGICLNAADEPVTPLYIAETLVDGKQPSLAGHSSQAPTTPASSTHKTYQVIDAAGALFASVEGSGDDARAVVYSKNTLGNITQVHRRNGDGTNTQLVRSYDYFNSGLLKSDTNAVGVKEAYYYNRAGVIGRTFTVGADQKLYSYNFHQFDEFGRIRSTYEKQSATGVLAEYEYVGASGGYAITEENDAFFDRPRQKHYSYESNWISEHKPNGYVCSKYFPCAEKSVENGIESIKHFNFSTQGQLKNKIEVIKSSNETRNSVFSYTYNPYGDLQSETLSGTGITPYGLTYSNRNGGSYKITDTHNETLWQLTATADNGSASSVSILGDNETVYATDALGRETTRSTLDATDAFVNNWNQGFNHLGTNAYRQSGTGTPQAENFKYDALGQIDNTEMAGTTPYDFSIDSLASITALRGANITRSTLDTGCATNTSIAGASLRTGSSPWIISGNDQVVGSYCYDQMGRQLINGENVLEYFANGQASKISHATAEINLAYDASGTPIYEKQTSSIASKNYSAWLFDGARVEQRNDNGVLSTRFYPINNLRISFASNSSTPIYDFVMTDTMGSTTGLARKVGNQLIVDPAKTRGYTPYGSQRNPDDWDVIQDIDIGDAYGFTGQRYLAEFGLYQYVGRIYDPKLGSFTGPDPIVAGEGNWKAYNPYTYVFNDPLGLVDPSGYAGVRVRTYDEGSVNIIQPIPVDPFIGFLNNVNSDTASLNLGFQNQLITSVNNTQFHFNQNLNLSQNTNNLSFSNVETAGGSIRSDVCASGSCHGADYTGAVYATDAQLVPLTITTAVVTSFVPLSAVTLPFKAKGVGQVGGVAFSGSGPARGILGLSAASKSNKAILNYFPKKGESVEFIFDIKQKVFLVGTPGKFKHYKLANTIGSKPSNVVGGMFSRGKNGEFITNEWSGTFWRNWNSTTREQFIKSMKQFGVNVSHSK